MIESNFVVFEGGGFFLRPRRHGGGGLGNGADLEQLLALQLGVAPGADCFGAAQPAVRYNSPTWGGFRFETSMVRLTWCQRSWMIDARRATATRFIEHPSTDNSHFWDIAVFYTADWNSIKISLAGAYTWLRIQPA